MSQVTPITGLIWGFVGTLAMVAVMQVAGDDSPPPFAVFWAQYVGDGNPADAMPESLLLHFGYGAAAGLVYAPVFGAIGGAVNLSTASLAGGVVWGIVWAAVLFVVGAVFWINVVLGLDPDRSDVIQFGIVHLAYGLTLGVLGALVPHLL